MQDEWDWGWVEHDQLKEFEGKFGRYIERIAKWPHFVVYDIDKASPYDEARQMLIREYCDVAYYYHDMDSTLQTLSLPRLKPSAQAEEDARNAAVERNAKLRKMIDKNPPKGFVMDKAYAEWLEATWVEINGGGVVTQDQIDEFTRRQLDYWNNEERIREEAIPSAAAS